MNRVLGITLVLVLALTTAAFAKPVDQTGTLDKFQYEDIMSPASDATSQGVFGTAENPGDAGTTYFGGTFWAADSARWEAVIDSCWTFETGVGSHFQHGLPNINPFKNTLLSAQMEGWIGIDNSFSEIEFFRRLTYSDFAGADTCVGAAAGLGGSASFYAGVLAAEADELCYAAGAGYGDNWFVCIGKSFAYASGGVTLSYDYVNDTEGGFDFSYVIVDTSGGNDEDVVVTSYDGFLFGNDSHNLTQGTNLPLNSTGSIVVKFCTASDGAYSDQDGNNPTDCGALAVDGITLSGAITDFADFETGEDGWARLAAGEGPGGDWSDLTHLDDLVVPLTPCECTLVDSVLVFEDLTVGGHGLFQDNLAASPWIDLLANGVAGAPGKFIAADVYTDMPLLNYIFAQGNVQWYPQVCSATGKLIMSPFTSDGFVIYFGDVPACTNVAGNPFRRNYGSIVDSGAEQMRIAVGMISFCRFFANCTGVTNSTPWFDNVALGIFGDPGAPLISTSTIDVPQDAFPENGTLRIDAPGRLDVNNVKGESQPEPGSSLGDTMIVEGATGGAEVYVEFAVTPGPGVSAPALAAFLATADLVGVREGQTWYEARMDTAENGGIGGTAGTWMSTHHEDATGFTGTDSDIDGTDAYPGGGLGRLANDIFPDDLFTPGTRVNLFFKTRFVSGTSWFTNPDTAAGTTDGERYHEFEVLPSSFAADSTFNCVLYVDHFSDRGAQPFVERGLAAVMTGSGTNFEGTPWDRYDVQAPSSQQASYGRPLNTEYGATILQTLGYKAILWNSGNLGAFNVVKEDADVLRPWLTLTDFGGNNLYLNGDGIAASMTLESASEPSATLLLEDVLGVLYTCNTIRNDACPTGTPQDTTACLDLDPVTGAIVSTRPNGGAPLAQGNGCPQLRSFDVLEVNGSALFGTATAEETYSSTVKGPGSGGGDILASVSLDADGTFGPVYRSVVDGLSVHYRRDPGACAFNLGSSPLGVEERLREVLTYFGFAGTPAPCDDPAANVSIGDEPRIDTFRTTLANFAPNPLLSGGSGRIQFTMAREGVASVDIFDVNGRLVKTVFDGVATEGPNEAFWDGTDASERPVASGVYFYRLNSNEDTFSKKMVVVRNGN